MFFVHQDSVLFCYLDLQLSRLACSVVTILQGRKKMFSGGGGGGGGGGGADVCVLIRA